MTVIQWNKIHLRKFPQITNIVAGLLRVRAPIANSSRNLSLAGGFKRDPIY